MARKLTRLNPSQAKESYLQALLSGDADAASRIIAKLVTGKMDLASIYSEVLTPAMIAIGESWCASRINVAQEHLATQITLGEMEKLKLMQPVPQPLPYRVMVACVEGESHCLGARMAADLFQLEGWSVDFLGPDVPTRALIDIVAARRVNLLCLSVTLESNLKALSISLKGLATVPDRPELIIGGSAGANPDVWRTDIEGVEVAKSVAEGVSLARKLFRPNRRNVILSDYLKQLGRRIRSLRLQAGWTQEQMAQATKLTRAYIVSVEGGKQNVSMDVVVRIANALNVPPEQLIAYDQLVRQE
jgi:MerR family transcriptional regulator, light-induced transcriptional regulator